MNKDAMGNFPPDKKAEPPIVPPAKDHPSPGKQSPIRKDESAASGTSSRTADMPQAASATTHRPDHDTLSERQQDMAARTETAPIKSEKRPIESERKELPVRRIRINGEELTGRFDRENGLVYLDDGRVVRVKPAAPPASPAAPEKTPESETHSLPGAGPIKRIAIPGYGGNDDTQKAVKQQKSRSGGNTAKVAVACCVLVALTVGFIKFGMPFIVKQTTGGGGSITSVIAGDEVSVIQLTKDVPPGTEITDDLIQRKTISSEAYNQIVLTGTDLYQWDRKEALLGMYVAAYLPRGQYLTYDSLVASYVIPRNPWGVLAEGEYIDIPIDLNESASSTFIPGNAFDITIKKSTVVEAPSNETTTEVDGLEQNSSVQQSVRVDSFKLKGVIAVDVIAESGSSIYETLYALQSIPAGEQQHYIEDRVADEAFAQQITPAYIRIAATEAQRNALGDLSGEDTQCTILILPNAADRGSNEKAEFFANAEALAKRLEPHVKRKEPTNEG